MFEDYGNGMVIDTSTGDVYDSTSAAYLGNDGANYFGPDYVSAGSENSPYSGWQPPDYSIAGDGSVTFTDGTTVNADGTISTGGQSYTVDQVKADPSLWDKITGVVSNSNFIKAAGVLGTGLAGQYFNNQAASAGQQAAQTALNAQLAGANSAGQLGREQFEYQKSLNEPFYNRGLEGFNQYASAVTGKPDANGKVWTPTDSPAYQWQQQQLEKNTGRTLRSLGRQNSTYGMNVMADQNRNLAASEYDKQLGRLADLTNIARGGASSLTGASGGYSTQQQNNLLNSANNQANASLAGGVMAQNNANNSLSNLYGTANLGLKAFGL